MHRWKVAWVTAACILVSAAAHARVFVCIENGQKVFRSAACPEVEQTVGRYDVPPVQVIRDPRLYHSLTADYDSSPVQVPQDDPRCKFSYFVVSERGKALAQDAKHECLQNLALENAGRSGDRSLSAYTMWKDYWDSARANTPRTMTCNYVGYGISTCR